MRSCLEEYKPKIFTRGGVYRGQDDAWSACPQCLHYLHKELRKETLSTCPKCQHHFPLSASERAAMLLDEMTPLFCEVASGDPLSFCDKMPYSERLRKANQSGMQSAMQTFQGRMGDHLVFLGILDFSYLGGSMGSA